MGQAETIVDQRLTALYGFDEISGVNMKLRTKGGRLTLGSAYKLIVWGWVLSWGALFGLILLLLLAITLLTGEMTVNGELVSGRVEALTAMVLSG